MKASIAIIGKLGHGKTYLLNKLCGTHHPSHMGDRSCTRTLQTGKSREHGFLVIDTPGFCASEDVAAHIAGQKLALEGTPLSGLYVVVKFGRADDMVELLDKVMNFVGSDDIRVIVTHADVASSEHGYDEGSTKERMSDLLDIPIKNIAIVGKETPASAIENFIASTLHKPTQFEISEEQVAAISSLAVGARKTNKAISRIKAKVLAAVESCNTMSSQGGGRSYETDIAILATQNVTTNMVNEEKQQIFRDAEDLSLDQQNLVYGKAGLALALQLQGFMEATNKLLSWDVTDTNDPRNHYRKCPHCGAIFNKTEGCDGNTICGAVPRSSKVSAPLITASFRQKGNSEWYICYIFQDGVQVYANFVSSEVKKRLKTAILQQRTGGDHLKQEGATFESGCGATIAWRTMRPLDEKEIAPLAKVERLCPGDSERLSRVNFSKKLRSQEARNKQILDRALANF